MKNQVRAAGEVHEVHDLLAIPSSRPGGGKREPPSSVSKASSELPRAEEAGSARIDVRVPSRRARSFEVSASQELKNFERSAGASLAQASQQASCKSCICRNIQRTF